MKKSFCLQKTFESISVTMASAESIMLIDDCIDEEVLHKRRNGLAKLVISGRHRDHSLWMPTQRYIAIPRLVRVQLYTVILLPLKDGVSFVLIIEENGGSVDIAAIDEI